jgi:biotin transporter BioY
MIKYIIMSWLIGFSGRKFFYKDKNTREAVKFGCVSLVIMLVVYVILE